MSEQPKTSDVAALVVDSKSTSTAAASEGDDRRKKKKKSRSRSRSSRDSARDRRRSRDRSRERDRKSGRDRSDRDHDRGAYISRVSLVSAVLYGVCQTAVESRAAAGLPLFLAPRQYFPFLSRPERAHNGT